MRKYITFALLFAFSQTSLPATAQTMSYGSEYRGGGTYTEERPPNDGLIYEPMFDGERGRLPSDVSFSNWARTKLDDFNYMDADGDRVLSELDLRVLDKADTVAWSASQIARIFTSWLPDAPAHLEKLKKEIHDVAQLNPLLKQTDTASESLESIFTSMGLLNQDDPVYIRATPGDAEIVKTGYVAEKSRAWAQVTIPFELQIFSGDGESKADFEATLLVMRRFPRHMQDDQYAIWDIRVGAAQ